MADQPFQERAEGPTGEVVALPALQVLDLPGAAQEPGYPLALLVAAYVAQHTGDWDTVHELCRRALEAERRGTASRHGGRIEMDVRNLQAQASLAGNDYADAVSGYNHAAELAAANGYLGLAAIYLAYGVSSAVLGSVALEQAAQMAEKAVALARRSGMPSAIVISLNSLALVSVDRDPARSRALLRESLDLATTPGEEISSGIITAAMVAGRLRDWELALTLAARTMYLWRWNIALMQSAPCLALCARAVAERLPEVAGVLRGSAIAAYRAAGLGAPSTPRPKTEPTGSHVNFVTQALRETGEIVAAALGKERQRELRDTGASMSMDDAVSYALANVDPKLLVGPVF